MLLKEVGDTKWLHSYSEYDGLMTSSTTQFLLLQFIFCTIHLVCEKQPYYQSAGSIPGSQNIPIHC